MKRMTADRKFYLEFLKIGRDIIDKDIDFIRKEYKEHKTCTMYMEDHKVMFSILVRIDIFEIEDNEVKKEIYNRLKNIDFVVKLRMTNISIYFNTNDDKTLEIINLCNKGDE